MFQSRSSKRRSDAELASSFRAKEGPAQRQREAEKAHKEPHYPTQPGRIDAVGQRIIFRFCRDYAYPERLNFFGCRGFGELWADCDLRSWWDVVSVITK